MADRIEVVFKCRFVCKPSDVLQMCFIEWIFGNFPYHALVKHLKSIPKNPNES